MALDLLHGLQASDATFKITALLAIACAYVVFELALTALKRRRGSGRSLAHASSTPDVADLAVEAYRPVTSWTSRIE